MPGAAIGRENDQRHEVIDHQGAFRKITGRCFVWNKPDWLRWRRVEMEDICVWLDRIAFCLPAVESTFEELDSLKMQG